MDARAGIARLALAACGTTACFPPVDPAWLEVEPELLALRIEVVDEGVYSEQLAPVPADRVRVEALPGDTIRFVPWVLAQEGVLGEHEIDAAYFACSAVDCGDFSELDPMKACDGTFDPDEPCAIGRGPEARFTIPTPGPEDLGSLLFQQIVVVAGQPGVRSTDDCLALLAARPYEDLHGCMLLERLLPIGPQWVIAAAIGIDSPDDLPEIPPEVLFQPPNFNPEVGRILVERHGAGSLDFIEAHSGERLTIGVGDRVRVTVDPDPRDEQQYAVSVVDGNVLRNREGLRTDWYSSALVSTDDELWVGAALIDWRAPSEPGEVRLDVLLLDGTGGLGWGELTFDVE